MSRSLALALAAGGAAALAACATPAPDPYAPLDADAHEMSPYKIHEACVKLAPGDRLDWRCEAQAPVDFNIHYRAGPTVVLPVSRAASRAYRLKGGGEPLWGGWMAPPRTEGELSLWQERLNVRYDVGMLYTIVAGLLNILAIYDATCGPVVAEGDEPAVKRLKPKKGKA